MKNLFLLLLMSVSGIIYSQDDVIDYNWIVEGGDVTRLNQVPSNWTVGNPCDVPFYTDVFVLGDLTLKEDCYIQHARLTVYGDIIYNGFTITLKCDSSELIPNATLSSPEQTLDEISVWPNPTTGVFRFNIKVPYRVDVYDMSGRLVANTNNISDQASGLYLAVVTIKDTNQKRTFKIIKK